MLKQSELIFTFPPLDPNYQFHSLTLNLQPVRHNDAIDIHPPPINYIPPTVQCCQRLTIPFPSPSLSQIFAGLALHVALVHSKAVADQQAAESQVSNVQVAQQRVGTEYLPPVDHHVDHHHDHHHHEEHDPGFWKKTLKWKEGWKKIWKPGKKQIWRTEYKKIWKPIWVPTQVPGWKEIQVPDWKKITVPVWKEIQIPAWKEIQVPDWKQYWVPEWKKVSG